MKYTFFLALMIAPFLAAAQTHNFRHYQTRQMLSNNWVRSIAQDQYGFMWFGTHDGLNRFDGYNFKVFRHNEKDTNSLGSSDVGKVFVSRTGKMYLGTSSGMFIYNAELENFRQVPGTQYKAVIEICEDRAGTLFYLADGEVYRYVPGTDLVKLVLGTSTGRCTSLTVDHKGGLWVGTANGFLLHLDTGSGALAKYPIPPFSSSLEARIRPLKIKEIAGDALIIGTDKHGAKQFDLTGHHFTDIPIPDLNDGRGINVTEIVQSTANEYWLSSHFGVFIYDTRQKSVVNHLQSDAHLPSSLSNNVVFSMYRDREGGFWVGTYSGGVNYYSSTTLSFRQFVKGHGTGFLSGKIISTLCEDSHRNIWIGTEDAGLNKLAPKGNKLTQFPYGTREGITPFQNLRGLTIGPDDRLWVAGYGDGIDVIDLKSKQKKHYRKGPSTFLSDYVFCIFKTRANKILIGTEHDVVEFDPRTSQFRTLISDIRRMPRYYCIQEDRAGNIWIGTRGQGLLRYDLRSKQVERFVHKAGDTRSLGYNHVNDVFLDSKGNIWVATDGGGLCRFDSTRNNFTKTTLEDGLPTDYVFKTLEDNRGFLWISTSDGLVCMDPVTGKKRVYTTRDGLVTSQFNFWAGLKASDGTLYFGTVEGLVSFNPDLLLEKSRPLTPALVTGVLLNNKEVRFTDETSPIKESVLTSSKITLPYNQATFSLDFGVLNFESPLRITYAYKMQGLENEWTILQAGRRAYFTKLPPGQYVFLVKAADSNGIWQQKASSIEVEITPPFWATWWARTLYAILGVALVYGLMLRYRMRQRQRLVEQQKQYALLKERELYESKLEFLSGIAHELNTPLTLIKGPLEEVMQHPGNPRLVEKYTGMIARNTDRLVELCQQILDFRKTESNGYKLNSSQVDFSALVHEQVKPFLDQAEGRHMQHVLELPSQSAWVMGDQEALTKIISNLFSNAFKYGEKKFICKLVLEKDTQNCHVRLTVLNDGPIIPSEMRERIFEPFVRLRHPKSVAGTGIGLSISKSLADLHQANLYVEQQEGLNAFVFSIASARQNP